MYILPQSVLRDCSVWWLFIFGVGVISLFLLQGFSSTSNRRISYNKVPRLLFIYHVVRYHYSNTDIMSRNTQTSAFRVIIDPRSSYPYGSFYLYGLIELLGKKRVSFSLKPFQELGDPGWNFRFVMVSEDSTKRYFIHTNDTYHIDKKNYDWCDVYGHVNANFEHYPKDRYEKIISLAPSFGIRAMSLTQTMIMAMLNFLKAYQHIMNRSEWNKYKNKNDINKLSNIKHFFGRQYKTWKNRLPISSYDNSTGSSDDYIFFLSTLWYDHPDNQNDKGVNLRRAYFIRACKSLNIKFEGGLVGDDTSSRNLFADVLSQNKVEFADWIRKTKSSSVVFNTPAFWDCHGWKLGEYLAMGKCIISTKLSNDLPAPLVHGEHIHYVENTQEAMKEALEYILSHPEYKRHLEQGATVYWKKYGTPIQSLKLLGF